MYKNITNEDKEAYNRSVSHPLQAFEWGEFRKKTGIPVIRKGVFVDNKLTDGFQMTLHPIPHTPFSIGYLPKGTLPTKELLSELTTIGKENRCIFIQLEPNVIRNLPAGKAGQEVGIRNYEKNDNAFLQSIIHDSKFMILPSAHPLFTKYTFVLDLTKSEEELLKNMHPKTRYNIKIAQKHSVEVAFDNSQKAFETYLALTQETTKRQRFYAHTKEYHRLMWETLKCQMSNVKCQIYPNELTARLLTARYKNEILVTWILFVFHNTLYYPYGASSTEYKETMASNLVMWEAIRYGKQLGLKTFDMWGALGPEPDPLDPWFGFHRFKKGYGGEHVEFVGSFDLILNSFLYQGYKLADKIRWLLLRN